MIQPTEQLSYKISYTSDCLLQSTSPTHSPPPPPPAAGAAQPYKYYKGEGIGKIDWSKPHNLLKVDTKLLKLFPNSRGMQIHHSKAAAATSWLCFHSRLEMNPSEYMNHVISKSSNVKESSKKYICIYINQPKKWFSNKTKWLELIILDLQEISVGLF